jgi:SAM-dependent methyltransferase
MSLQTDGVVAEATRPLTEPLACPPCRAPARRRRAAGAGEAVIASAACGARYEEEDGFPVLLVPGDRRFEDAEDCCMFDAEEATNRHTVQHYYLPLLERLFGRRRELRLLSAGCGVGTDIDLYRAAGIEAYGIDCGRRSVSWSRRQARDAFHIGTVERLPYRDASFDVVVTGCLLPHIGVEGDTVQTLPDAQARRERAARELIRVTRRGGQIITGCPNRLCPADLFHKGQMTGRSGIARWHARSEPFLLGFDDFEQLFRKAGARAVATLPVAHYWGFHTKRRDPKMWLFVAALDAWFDVLSFRGADLLRRSGLNPWLMVRVAC